MESKLIFDLVFVAILIGSIAISASKGAIKAISGIAGTLLGTIGAYALLSKVSPLTESLLLPFTRNAVEKAIDSSGFAGMIAGNMSVESLSKLGSLFSFFGMDSKMESLLSAMKEIGGNVVDAASIAIARQFAPVITFFALFVLIKLIVSIILMILDMDIPVLRTLNKTAGALLGALSGFIVIFVLCWGVVKFAPEEDYGFISKAALQQSIIGGAITRVLE